MEHIGTQTIETDRLILRKIELKDTNDFVELLTDEKVLQYLGGIPSGYTLEMAESYIGNKLQEKYKNLDFYDWGIVEKKSNKLIGRITVYKLDDDKRMADLIWYLNSHFRQNGYITEAGNAVVQLLQNIGFERIEAFADVNNVASTRVMEKLGMEFEGILRKYDARRDGTLYDVKMYSIIKN